MHGPRRHSPLAQSPASRHGTPAAPGSHTAALHFELKQSAPDTHALPATHGPRASPPQSTSVSPPFFVQSAQFGLSGVGGWQARCAATQRPD